MLIVVVAIVVTSPSHATASDVVDSLSFETSSGTIELTDAECDLHHVQKELLGTFLALHSRREDTTSQRVALITLTDAVGILPRDPFAVGII